MKITMRAYLFIENGSATEIDNMDLIYSNIPHWTDHIRRKFTGNLKSKIYIYSNIEIDHIVGWYMQGRQKRDNIFQT